MAAPTGRFFPALSMHLGPNGTFAAFNETTLPLGGHLGSVIEDGGKCYRLVKFDNGVGNVATVAGMAAHWKDRDNFVVTSDQTDAQATISGVAGGFLGVVTDQNYCFVQCGGKQTGVMCAAATAIGDAMIGSVTDGTLTRMTATDVTIPVAVAQTNLATGTATVVWLLGNLL